MRDWRDADIWIIALLMGVIILLWMGFSEIFQRLRPRVLYLHRNPAPDDDDDESDRFHAAEG